MTPEFYKEAKARVDIPKLWSRFNFPGEVSGNCVVHSPFRKDRTPSFSIFSRGAKFKDHASDARGDIFDFVQLALGCSKKESEKWMAEYLGIKLESKASILPYKPLKRPSVASVVQTSQIKYNQSEPDWSPELLGFLKTKRISKQVFYRLFKMGYINLERGRLHYHYSTGTKVRWDWNDSHSTRWSHGGASDALWLDKLVANTFYTIVILTEGESDCMRLMSINSVDNICIASIPAASWTPSPVMSGVIANGRKVVLAFDNDEAGRFAQDRVAKALTENSLNSQVIKLKWPEGSPKDWCLCDSEEAYEIMLSNEIIFTNV